MDKLDEICASYEFDFAWLPFQSPETYSFTLSEIFKLRLPLISTEIGAISERCHSRENTILLKINADIEEILVAFYKLRGLICGCPIEYKNFNLIRVFLTNDAIESFGKEPCKIIDRDGNREAQ